MKKILCAVLVVLALSCCAHSLEKRIVRLGLLSKLNTTQEEFADTWKKTFAPKRGELEIKMYFYDSLNAMQMGLNAGDIQEMVLPEAVAEYVMNINPEYKASLVLRSGGMGLAFGFREDSRELRDKFNEALRALRENWTLAAIEGVYIASPGVSEPQPVKFATFDNADTIKVAVTGDLPPIDFIASDGTPAGFNTAVLAEIGNYLHMNISLVEIDAGARTAALASGRADVVFWYEVDSTAQRQPDIPDGVILSTPYYEWNRFIHVRRQKQQTQSGGWTWDLKQSIMNLYGW